MTDRKESTGGVDALDLLERWLVIGPDDEVVDFVNAERVEAYRNDKYEEWVIDGPFVRQPQVGVIGPDALVKALHRIAFPDEYEGSAEWSRGVAFGTLKAWREARPSTDRGAVGGSGA